MNIVQSALGHYEVVGDLAEAELVIGFSFGTRTDEGSPNDSLARLALTLATGRPIVVDHRWSNFYLRTMSR